MLDVLRANAVIVYFVYGQVFFTLGVAIALHSRKRSHLPIARHLNWLAGFGLVHGLTEWSHIFIPIQATYVSADLVSLLQAGHMLALALSFYLLLQFGILIALPSAGHRSLLYSFLIGVPLASLAAVPFLPGVDAQTGTFLAPLVPGKEASIRVALGLTGGAVASLGMYRQARFLGETGWPHIARYFRWTALCLAVYALAAGLLVPRAAGSTGELAGFLFLTNIPVVPGPVFRSIVGLGMAFGVIRGLGIFEMETERTLQEAERNRFRAAERARQSLDAMAATLGRRMPKESLLDAALERVLDVMGHPAGWVMLARAGDGALETRASRGLAQPVAPGTLCVGIEGCACSVLVSDPEADHVVGGPQCRFVTQAGPPCTWSVPLKAQDRVVGVLNVAGQESGPEDIGLLCSIGKQIGLALENADLWEELRRKEEVRAQLLARVIGAQEDERKRVARELHDETGQKLSAVIIGLGAAADALSRSAPREADILTDTREVAVEALEGIRQLILGLRPSILDDLGLAPALRRIAEELSKLSSMEIVVNADGLEGWLPPEAEIVLFRILQEGMNNAVRHSRARRAVVHLARNGSEASALLEDDGIGFDPAGVTAHAESGCGLGLIGMQERASLLGGEVRVDSAPGRGTRLHVRLPLLNKEMQ